MDPKYRNLRDGNVGGCLRLTAYGIGIMAVSAGLAILTEVIRNASETLYCMTTA